MPLCRQFFLEILPGLVGSLQSTLRLSPCSIASTLLTTCPSAENTQNMVYSKKALYIEVRREDEKLDISKMVREIVLHMTLKYK